jgi:DNA polymerase III delta prime subunit
MPRCSEQALETAISQLSQHAADNQRRSNWISAFLAAARAKAAGYEHNIEGINSAVEDLFVLLPDNKLAGRINPFHTGKNRWSKVVGPNGIRSGQSTVWNTSTRNGVQKVLFVNDHIKSGLKGNAIDILRNAVGPAPLPAREALAVFMTRNHDWETEPSPQNLVSEASSYLGLSADEFNSVTSAKPLGCAVLGDPEWSPELLAQSPLGPDLPQPSAPARVEVDPLDSPPPALADALDWTRSVSRHPLRNANVEDICSRVMSILADDEIVLPEQEALVRRCVTALLLGHLILQGPPGTGKTTLARALAEAFQAEVIEATATSEWSPFHVVGGYRPNSSGGLVPTHGKVVEAVLRCAETVRSDLSEQPGQEPDMEQPQGTWLFIDEFNRADIDKAIGSLYTLLSSCDPAHLDKTPLDLWFEEVPERQKVWVPARFRIIGAMNDLDTSFVNAISQGLTRRFHFVTIPASKMVIGAELSVEMTTAMKQAHRWITATYPDLSVSPFENVLADMLDHLRRFEAVLAVLRSPEGLPGWPIGTAQIVDVLKYVIVSDQSGSGSAGALDIAIADRLVPQMNQIDDQQESVFRSAMLGNGLNASAEALRHMLDPHAV